MRESGEYETLEQTIYRLEEHFEDEYNRVRRKPPLLQALLTEVMEKGVRDYGTPKMCRTHKKEMSAGHVKAHQNTRNECEFYRDLVALDREYDKQQGSN